ncbi:hypothetical protein [Achromobacter insuavis]|uniref:hypothetical protein n=1 Tax=Achromobacter insuavis TaxID=1287735 RepID=UPI0012F47E46|nr:hypothetical protein [Achromobacter insuavis]
MSFETDEEIEQWIGTHGIDEFKRKAEHGQFAGKRLENARAYLRRVESTNAEILNERLMSAAESAAASAKDQADTAKKALNVSLWALGVAIAALVASAAQWAFNKFP